jgi:hypothetical protein
MKPILLPLLAAAGAATAVISTKPPEPTGKWVKYKISNYFWAEGACVADVNAGRISRPAIPFTRTRSPSMRGSRARSPVLRAAL